MAISPSSPVPEALRAQRGPLIALGLLTLLGGTAALIWPIFASLAVTTLVGAAFLIQGAVQFWDALNVSDWKPRFWHSVAGLIALFGGAMLLLKPFAGIFALTTLLVITILLSGAARVAMALAARPQKGWGWLLLGGMVSILCGAYLVHVFLTAPTDFAREDDLATATKMFGFFALLGLFAGISLIFEGWGYLLLALALPKGAGAPVEAELDAFAAPILVHPPAAPAAPAPVLAPAPPKAAPPKAVLPASPPPAAAAAPASPPKAAPLKTAAAAAPPAAASPKPAAAPPKASLPASPPPAAAPPKPLATAPTPASPPAAAAAPAAETPAVLPAAATPPKAAPPKPLAPAPAPPPPAAAPAAAAPVAAPPKAAPASPPPKAVAAASMAPKAAAPAAVTAAPPSASPPDEAPPLVSASADLPTPGKSVAIANRPARAPEIAVPLARRRQEPK